VDAGNGQYNLTVVPFNNDGPGVNMIIGQADLVALARYQILPPVMGVGNYTLLPGMSYTWQVRTSPSPRAIGLNDTSWSEFTAARTFKTGAPSSSTIQAVFPFSTDSTVDSLTPTLRWTDQNSQIFYYELQLSTDSSFETDPAKATAAVFWELVHGGQTDPLNSYKVKDAYKLEPNTQYFWRVRPRVQGDGTPVPWTETWSFRTQ
jgi:hypothetical protein